MQLQSYKAAGDLKVQEGIHVYVMLVWTKKKPQAMAAEHRTQNIVSFL